MKVLDIKQQNTKAGKPMILVSTLNHQIWITPKQHKSKGGSYVLENYKGGDIAVDWYEVGDVMLNGKECTTSHSVQRDYALTANPAVLAAALDISEKAKFDDAMDMGDLFAKRKAERDAKALLDADKPEGSTIASEEVVAEEELQPAGTLNGQEED